MDSVHQLELNLEVALEEAAERPEVADVLGLWRQFAGELSGLSQRAIGPIAAGPSESCR